MEKNENIYIQKINQINRAWTESRGPWGGSSSVVPVRPVEHESPQLASANERAPFL